MKIMQNQKLTPVSKVLRRNMTKEEKHLWYDFLKKLPVCVHRQKVIGKYIVDFYCAEASIVIELDGSQHYEEDARFLDQERDNYLSQMGIKVLRYTNRDIHDRFDAVCKEISISFGLMKM